MMKPEINSHECVEMFRANRLKETEDILVQKIVAGKFSWANGVVPAGSTKAVTHIYTAPFIAWLEEMLGHPARGKHMLEEDFGEAE